MMKAQHIRKIKYCFYVTYIPSIWREQQKDIFDICIDSIMFWQAAN